MPFNMLGYKGLQKAAGRSRAGDTRKSAENLLSRLVMDNQLGIKTLS